MTDSLVLSTVEQGLFYSVCCMLKCLSSRILSSFILLLMVLCSTTSNLRIGNLVKQFHYLLEVPCAKVVFNQDLTDTHHQDGIDIVLQTHSSRLRKVCRLILNIKTKKLIPPLHLPSFIHLLFLQINLFPTSVLKLPAQSLPAHS